MGGILPAGVSPTTPTRPVQYTLGIICKTEAQAERLYQALRDIGHDAHLLAKHSTAFALGITVCTAHMAKGLEFDQVIVPDASDKNYGTRMDRNLLYVACTRAMHVLTLTFAGVLTPLVPHDAVSRQE